MIVGSLFSGIGGMDLGLARAGFRHAFFCESDPWRREVLAAHWPGVPIYQDVRAFDPTAWAMESDLNDERWEEHPTHPSLTPNGTTQNVLISSAEDFPARTSPSPDDAEDSLELAPASSTSSRESLSLFDLDGYSSRTYPDCSPRTAVGTSESCLERWPTSGTAWHGGLSTAVSSECRSDEGGCSSSEPSLSQILEEPQSVPARYLLSARAAQGILRRAEKRGRTLSSHLSAALEAVAQTTTTGREVG